jgi:hypothetical protein
VTHDPKNDLVAFLRANFDSTALSVSFTPGDETDTTADGDIKFADYDGAREYPQVAVVSKDSTVVGGGDTQVSAMDGGGGGPVQNTIYLIQVDCWGGPDDAPIYESGGSHPDIVANELGEEVAATCRVGTDGAPDGYGWMMSEPPFEADDTNETPARHREIVTVRMATTYG